MSRIQNGERIVSSTNVAGETGYPHAREWKCTSVLCNTQKLPSQLKMHLRLRCKTPNCETPRRKHRGNVSWQRFWQWFYRYDIKSIGNKNKNRQVGGHQTKKSAAQQRKQLAGWKKVTLWNGGSYLAVIYLTRDQFPECIQTFRLLGGLLVEALGIHAWEGKDGVWVKPG